jgi:tetratricopeptide (TPR) repeat protein
MTLNDLGSLYHQRHNIVAAAHCFEEALQLLDADHAWRGILLSNLGRTYEARQQLPRAEQLYREAVGLNRRHFGPEHDLVGTDLMRLGELLYSRHRNTEAEPALREALAIFKARLGPSHPYTVETSALLERIDAESHAVK